jgi:two-component system KDP operon response regulator KdpE
MATKQLLWVDDNSFVLTATRHLLETKGYTVVTAPNGETALACRKPFDLAVLDYNLPDISGLVVARELRKRRPCLPILMYSGCPNIPDDVMNDVAAFVSKGEPIQKLLDTIGELTTRVA